MTFLNIHRITDPCTVIMSDSREFHLSNGGHVNGDSTVDPETERGWYWFNDVPVGQWLVPEDALQTDSSTVFSRAPVVRNFEQDFVSDINTLLDSIMQRLADAGLDSLLN